MKQLPQTIISLILACVIVVPVQAANQMYFIHNDHLGTPQVVTDQSQTVVWEGKQKPFGEVEETTSSIEQLSRFPGQYFDEESNLHYNYFRDYDPSLGRYIQSDPIGLEGGLNTYGYVLANSIRFSDALGLNPCWYENGKLVCGSWQDYKHKDGKPECRTADCRAYPADRNNQKNKDCRKVCRSGGVDGNIQYTCAAVAAATALLRGDKAGAAADLVCQASLHEIDCRIECTDDCE